MKYRLHRYLEIFEAYTDTEEQAQNILYNLAPFTTLVNKLHTTQLNVMKTPRNIQMSVNFLVSLINGWTVCVMRYLGLHWNWISFLLTFLRARCCRLNVTLQLWLLVWQTGRDVDGHRRIYRWATWAMPPPAFELRKISHIAKPYNLRKVAPVENH